MLTTADITKLKKTFVTKKDLKIELSKFATKEEMRQGIFEQNTYLVQEMEKSKKEFRGEMKRFREEINNKVDTINERIDAMGKRMNAMSERMDEKHNDFMNIVDTFMGEIKSSREEQTVLFYRQKNHTNKLENHEDRIIKVETNFALAG